MIRLMILAAIGLVSCVNSQAGSMFTIDMEGIAPDGNQTVEQNASHQFGDFTLSMGYGHFVDSAHSLAGGRPSNGTDWFMSDWLEDDRGFDLTKTSGGSFSLLSFDATEWTSSFSPGTLLTVTGKLSSGAFVSQQFTTDSSPTQFETFVLNDSFLNVVSVHFEDEGNFTNAFEGKLGFDNIVVAPVPEPTSFAIIVVASGLLVTRRRR
ncbi:MAG: PEP-CTERM sorting domain-containing protein [Planctomycetota bacterium]